MNSNDQDAPYGRWATPPQRPRSFHPPSELSPFAAAMMPRPPVREDSLKSGSVQIERKNFIFALKENPRGRLLRITEDINGRYNSIIIPATGLRDFLGLLDEMIKASEQQR